MSNVSNRHDVVPFIAGTSAPLSGQRLARAGYKKTKENPNPPASVCASIPQIDPDAVRARIDKLLPFIGNMLEAAQDGILRSLYESSDYALQVITDADISVDACIAFMGAENAGSRLTADAIKVWFADQVEENLTVHIAEKLGFAELTEDNMVTITEHVGIFRDVLAMLAGGKTVLQDRQISGCRKAIALAAASGGIGAKLVARLDAMELAQKKADSFLDL